jgi:hypothetical protein
MGERRHLSGILKRKVLLDTVSITVTVSSMPTTLTLTGTVDLAQRVLDANNVAPASKRAAAELSGRLVRWYASAGILDSPGRDGHSATYGRRHLLQLLYTRQAQGDGVALEKVRADISGISNEKLRGLINLDLSLVPGDLGDVQPRKDAPFWEQTPSDGPAVGPREEALISGAVALRSSERLGGSHVVRANAEPAALEYTVRMGPVSVVLGREPTDSELTSLGEAAGELVSVVAGIQSSLSPQSTKRRKS